MSFEARAPAPHPLAIVNIGRLYTGDIARPALEAEAVYVENGRIAALGANSQILGRAPHSVLDARGLTVMPGLIDCHVHPLIGDWTPRHKILDWLSGYGRGGVTTVVSQGAPHLQGRPRDGLGAKLVAMLSARTFDTFRPGGVRVAGGVVLLEPGLGEDDFREMHAAGVRYVGEIGISGIRDPEEAAPMVRVARSLGWRISMHFGGPSIAGSRAMGLAEALAIAPDVVAHVNGGSTGRPDEEVLGVLQTMPAAFVEGCYHGGLRQLVLVARTLAERRELGRLVFGSDSPSSIGITPQAILRMIAQLAGLTDITVGELVAAASGNAGRAFALGRGTLTPGAPADLLVVDAPLGGVADDATAALVRGDMPSIALTLQEGRPLPERALNTPFPNRDVAWITSRE
jgi:enamidase